MRDVHDINYQRGERAYRALLAYSSYSIREHVKEDVEALSIDLLTDLQHMLEDYGDDFDHLVEVAKRHYEEEIAA